MSADAYKSRSKHKRNDALCARYVGGETLAELAIAYKITETRTWQIVNRAGLLRGHFAPRTRTGRTAYIAAYVHPNLKLAMDEAANGNRSELISQCMIEGLERRGIKVDLTEVKDDRALPLPLEGKGNN